VAHAVPQQSPDSFEQVIAGHVAKLVVYLLEIVQIDEEHGPGGAVAGSSINLLRQCLFEMPSVKQAGKEIVVYEKLEASRQLPTLGYVLNLCD
jgi:hypothetical protein